MGLERETKRILAAILDFIIPDMLAGMLDLADRLVKINETRDSVR